MSLVGQHHCSAPAGQRNIMHLPAQRGSVRRSNAMAIATTAAASIVHSLTYLVLVALFPPAIPLQPIPIPTTSSASVEH
ncbi:hypothetical protein THAOC_29228 [Thalassiosira oceanica]|uniref:Uncharacterized protein n=1 Tax=Thalassiosira oceanica TaxID=159749 RepID=K0REE7_THAOC|nr:hypothetical protein THAOC_29228 [Thalassiosira oceanica]|eukprot:EJK51585.1 hypothetical protein THAOC_29228 [Thalassiosira oceanica]